jgi:hypothetical protein
MEFFGGVLLKTPGRDYTSRRRAIQHVDETAGMVATTRIPRYACGSFFGVRNL